MVQITTEQLIKQLLSLINELKPLIIKHQLTNITINSKECDQHTVFAATKGFNVDARNFIPDAVERGSKVILTHNENLLGINSYVHREDIISGVKVDIFEVYDLNKYLSFLTLKFYDFLASASNPQKIGLEVPVIGVTGTNGKTLTTNLIAQGLSALTKKSSPYVIGTIGLGAYKHLQKATNTTPDACTVLDTIFQADYLDSSAVIMEVSSHGLALNRVRNVRFKQAIFTNLTQDHLDYHKTIENYFQAKARFFTKHNVNDYIITCTGDENDYGGRLVKLISLKLAQNNPENGSSRGVSASTPALLSFLGAIPPDEHVAGAKNTLPNPLGENDFLELQPEDYDLVSQVLNAKVKPRLAVINIGEKINEIASFKADIVVNLLNVKAHPQGLTISFSFEDKIKELKVQKELNIPLLGIFNAYNILTTITSLYLYGLDLEQILNYVPEFKSVKGRMEVIPNSLNKTVVVDFAHTPDALSKAIESIKVHFKDTPNSKITVVFGCGGDRDASKRPIMGKIASTLADKVIITDDNPRSEDPEKISQQIYEGVINSSAEVTYIANRKQAIIQAIEQAQPGDCVLIAGKGHETEQIIGSQTLHFSDQETVNEYFASKTS
ncbi:Mur ligase family protein [Psittacicella gerlachiana]|uniref:UDP-N-acetylmuramoyl-L-alanyl-D-glutamate--2,6-diaminopimelate ligase n=1 Tax=Psittacicella gerlachiana TaxID=2028574 RepID=A0A3A1YJV8_9GAMM|nr:UDP-N-acetylmuramoyl-L-alanyl-D-glutamate--2,6-diaminopimelate ligase [Psittacicella gerlachiana]RIY37871.1 hypothetical protein CKF59_01305 [Psittacicella gerlachiana]